MSKTQLVRFGLTLIFCALFISSDNLTLAQDFSKNPNQTVALKIESDIETYYHWDDPVRAKLMTEPGKFNFLNFRGFAFGPGYQGAGYYMAEWPASTQYYGPFLIETTVPKTFISENKDNIYCYNHNSDYSRHEDWWVIKVDKILGVTESFVSGLPVLGDLGHFLTTFNPLQRELHKKLNKLPIRFQEFTGDNFNSYQLLLVQKQIEVSKSLVHKKIQESLKSRSFRWGCLNNHPICLEFKKNGSFISSLPFEFCNKKDYDAHEEICSTENRKDLKEVLAGPLSKSFKPTENNNIETVFIQEINNTQSIDEIFGTLKNSRFMTPFASPYIMLDGNEKISLAVTEKVVSLLKTKEDYVLIKKNFEEFSHNVHRFPLSFYSISVALEKKVKELGIDVSTATATVETN